METIRMKPIDLRDANVAEHLVTALDETERFIGRVEKGLGLPAAVTVVSWVLVVAGYMTPITGLLTSIFFALFRLNLVAILVWNAVKSARFMLFQSVVASRAAEESIRREREDQERYEAALRRNLSGTGRPRWVSQR